MNQKCDLCDLKERTDLHFFHTSEGRKELNLCSLHKSLLLDLALTRLTERQATDVYEMLTN